MNYEAMGHRKSSTMSIFCVTLLFWISAMALFALSLNGDESAKEIVGFWLKVFLVSLFGVVVIPS